jgi:hypothetical protein
VEAGLRDAMRAGSLRVGGRPIVRARGRTLLACDSSGRCAFYEPGPRTCAVHRHLGHEALPVSCRLFPRLCLLTPRGVDITLSHYCPTAAGLLLTDEGPVRVVVDAAGFPEGAQYEGLDARLAPPPLLRPGVWLGWDGHERWQRHVLDVLGRSGPPDAALGLLSAQAEEVRSWTAERGPFPEYLEEVLGRPVPGGRRPPAADELHGEVVAAIPDELRPWRSSDREASCDGFEAPIRRYLMARAFAAWVGIQGPGLRTAVRALQAALVVLRREAARLSADAGRAVDAALMKDAFRQADLRLVHLASPEALASALGRCESA